MPRSAHSLTELLDSQPVVTLPQIQAALDDASRATAFRYLRQIPYRRSYNHNGRYYARDDPQRYDRVGLFSWRDIYFSRDGSLKATVRRLVHEAEAGTTQRELQDLLRVRVQTFLLDLWRHEEIGRERFTGLYVYVHVDVTLRKAQLEQRRERIAARTADTPEDLPDALIIAVLLTLIRHPGSGPPDVLRHLRGHAPPISFTEVRAVFSRYDLGEKGGSSIC